MMYCDLVSVRSGYHQFWNGYILGSRLLSIFPQSLVRFFEKDKWDLQWCFDFDLKPLGVYDKPEVSLKPASLYALRNNGWPAAGDQPPVVVTPPVVDPPPVIVPPVEPPPVVMPGYEIVEIERQENKNTPVLVGSWVRKNDAGILTSPGGNVTKFITGTKSEYGVGGYEAGYIREAGIYQVKISDSIFTFATDGKQFVKLAWRETQQAEQMVRLVSEKMAKAKAVDILATLNDGEYKGVFTMAMVGGE